MSNLFCGLLAAACFLAALALFATGHWVVGLACVLAVLWLPYVSRASGDVADRKSAARALDAMDRDR